jgi:hypothetical protein
VLVKYLWSFHCVEWIFLQEPFIQPSSRCGIYWSIKFRWFQ